MIDDMYIPTKRYEIIRIINDFLENNPSAEFQFGHIVFSDHNLDDDSIKFSLETCFTEAWIQEARAINYHPISDAEIERCKSFLQWLLTIPEDVRCEDEEIEEF